MTTEEQQHEEIQLFNEISPYFSIRTTKYEGRSCFAKNDLDEGTIIHECSSPISSTICLLFELFSWKNIKT